VKRVAFFLSALALTASLAFVAPQAAPAARSSARRIAETTIPKVRVWVTFYKDGFGDMRSIVGSGWMSAGEPFYIHFVMTNNDGYHIRAQVHADATASNVIADTTASFHNRTGVSIYLRKNADGYYWGY
jgi:hypothetical protein